MVNPQDSTMPMVCRALCLFHIIADRSKISNSYLVMQTTFLQQTPLSMTIPGALGSAKSAAIVDRSGGMRAKSKSPDPSKASHALNLISGRNEWRERSVHTIIAPISHAWTAVQHTLTPASQSNRSLACSALLIMHM
jgi:hypothetical protein